jgi:hypothetical protein
LTKAFEKFAGAIVDMNNSEQFTLYLEGLKPESDKE